eukprot:CAMPEP_0197539174 /NCGR_PEP_ID=MMETSP1318-20131121/61855_1 /TAXON_ID=552666 /ORGANISM="Partenskyella glossopodia, Strain RCC365" /LENGTH=375 /DNA_ID=CAMNT_0043097811 /DNA_START=91 /DNA_END=1215 /DNA_ORIENTATION=-
MSRYGEEMLQQSEELDEAGIKAYTTISQVENRHYTHAFVRAMSTVGMGITHSGVLVETRFKKEEKGEENRNQNHQHNNNNQQNEECNPDDLDSFQTVVDLIQFRGRPYVAVRHYRQRCRIDNWDDELLLATFFREGDYDTARKPWTRTTLAGKPVRFRVAEVREEEQQQQPSATSNAADSGSSSSSSSKNNESQAQPDPDVAGQKTTQSQVQAIPIRTQAQAMHTKWVERIKSCITEGSGGEFKMLSRNCQHAAAYTMNKLKHEAGVADERNAVPPNLLFRLLAPESRWIPSAPKGSEKDSQSQGERGGEEGGGTNREENEAEAESGRLSLADKQVENSSFVKKNKRAEASHPMRENDTDTSNSEQPEKKTTAAW